MSLSLCKVNVGWGWMEGGEGVKRRKHVLRDKKKKGNAPARLSVGG